jgi:ParB family chromosome partitioning protein
MDGSSDLSFARQAINLPIDQISPDSDQPRKSLHSIDGRLDAETEEALKELAEDIADKGLHQPITVRQTGPEKYVIIMGERRWRAFQLNQKKGIPHSASIPAFIRQDLAAANLRLSQLSENLQRSNLSDVEIANFLQSILEEYPELKRQDLAKLLNRNRQWVARILNVLDPRWAAVIDTGIITYASLLEHFKTLPQEKQTELIARAQAEKRALNISDIKKAHAEVKTATIHALQHDSEPLDASKYSAEICTELVKTDKFQAGLQEVLNNIASEGESYTPPSPSAWETSDFSSRKTVSLPEPIILNSGLRERREVKITLGQIEKLLETGAVKDKSYTASLMLPTEYLKEIVHELGEKIPDNDASLVAILLNKLKNL